MSKKADNLTVKCHSDVAAYILNEKRDHLLSIETSYGVSIFVAGGDDIKGSQAVIERAGERNLPARRPSAAAPVKIDSAFEVEDEAEQPVMEAETSEEAIETREADEDQSEDESDQDNRRRRRRGRRGGRRGRGRDFEAADRDSVTADNLVPGLGEQPAIPEAEAASTSVENEAEAAATEEGELSPANTDEMDGEAGRRRDHGRGRRDRWGRDRKRDRGLSRDRRETKIEEAPQESEATSVAPEALPPSPSPASAREISVGEEPVSADEEAQPRKWTPPPPTVTDRPAQAKVGWWSRRA